MIRDTASTTTDDHQAHLPLDKKIENQASATHLAAHPAGPYPPTSDRVSV